MPRRALPLALLTAGLLAGPLLGGCATTDVISPPPGTAAEPPPAAAPPTGPSRPRDIDVSGILACELLTPALLTEFRLDGEPRNRTSTDDLFGQARTCSVSGRDERPRITTDVSLVGEYGIERFAEPGVQDGVRPLTIAGYPAVLSPPRPSAPTNCLVAVDVHPGQMVGVLLADGGNQPRIPLDTLCADAERLAEAVMENLLAR